MKIFSIFVVLAFLTQGCAMRVNKKVVAVGALTIGSAIVAAKADQDCRRNVGVGGCYGGYGPAKAEEGVRISFAVFSVAMGAWWKRDFGRGWWAFPVGVAAWNFTDAGRAWGKTCPAGKTFVLDDCR
jgi:hypothetical protein